MCLPARIYRRFSFAVVLFAMLLQLLTFTPLGVEVNGNAGWIGKRGVFTMQPAEVMKLALCIWLPAACTGRRNTAVRSASCGHTPP